LTIKSKSQRQVGLAGLSGGREAGEMEAGGRETGGREAGCQEGPRYRPLL
jgi:hypothetical protein